MSLSRGWRRASFFFALLMAGGQLQGCFLQPPEPTELQEELPPGDSQSAAPVVTSVTPNSGDASGNYEVTIQGQNFQPGAKVTFGSAAALAVAVRSAGEIRAKVPAGNGTVAVRVTNPDGLSATLANGFSYVAPQSSPNRGVLFKDDFETCDFSKYSDKAGNVIERGLAHSGQCSSRTGAGSTDFGKLIVRFRDANGVQQTHDDLWMRGWVYFHENYPVPCCGEVLISPHLWRFQGPKGEFQRDFSTVQGQDRVRDHYSGLAPEIVRYYDNTFHFASDDRRGRWQCWEIRTKLNTPGQADGVSEFYADGVLIGRSEGLNIRGSSSVGIGAVDVQSNVAKPSDASLPPEMWWLVDDIVISTERPGCGAGSEAALARESETGSITVLEEGFETGDWSQWASSTLLVSNEQAAAGSFSARADHHPDSLSTEAAEVFFGDYLNQAPSLQDVSVNLALYLDEHAEVRASPCGLRLALLAANDDGQRLYAGELPFAPYHVTLCLNAELEPVVLLRRSVDASAALTLTLNQNQTAHPRRLELGRWQQLRLRARLNTPGASDGGIDLWLNGRLVARYDGLDLRGSFSGKGWNMFRLSAEEFAPPSRSWRQYWDSVSVVAH